MKSRLIKKIKGQEGITLAELLMVMGLMFLIIGMISAAYFQSINSTRDVVKITKSEIDSRVAVYSISKDVRESLDILLADNTEIKFSSNIDADDEFETVHYYLELKTDGSYDLMKGIDGQAGKIIIQNIVNEDLFNYYTGPGSPEGGMTEPVVEIDLNKIKLVGINISVDQSGAVSLQTMDLDTIIALRNKL